MACFMTLYIADNKHIVAQMFVQISKGFPYGETFEIFKIAVFYVVILLYLIYLLWIDK